MKIYATLAFLVLMLLLSIVTASYVHANDKFVRSQVVKIVNPEGGSCTGVRIKTKTKFYILTAAHCYELRTPIYTNNYVSLPLDGYTVLSKEGSVLEVLKLVAIDEDVDLMLIESHSGQGLILGKKTTVHEKVHTITHGAGLPLYRTNGELIASEYDMSENWFGYPHNAVKTITTAFIVPGSSGGPLLNEQDELIGIAVMIWNSPFFSFHTPLSQIKTFLRGR